MAFNPFAQFHFQMFEGFYKKGQRYFVSQTYDRAKDPFDDKTKGYYLLSHYDDIGLAQNHLHVIRHDPNARIYDWTNETDKEDLKKLFAVSAGNKIFTKLIADPKWDEKAKAKYKTNIIGWIGANTSWSIPRETTLPIKFQVIFGEFFISMKWRNEERRIKFEEIERY